MTASQDRVQAAAREDVCRFLAACHYQPDPVFAEEHLFESMLAAAEHIDDELAALARALREAFAAQPLQALLVDYTRLFLGPGRPLARPYGSCWLDDESNGGVPESTVAVQALYRQGGFEIDEDFGDLPDHVAVELEFLYLTEFRCSEAMDMDDDEALAAARALRQRFIAEHLGRWIGPFAAAVRSGARTDFYRRLASLTERFVRLESGA